jgi:hypothetical protein
MHPFLRILMCTALYPLYVIGIVLLSIIMTLAYPVLLAYMFVCALSEEI